MYGFSYYRANFPVFCERAARALQSPTVPEFRVTIFFAKKLTTNFHKAFEIWRLRPRLGCEMSYLVTRSAESTTS